MTGGELLVLLTQVAQDNPIATNIVAQALYNATAWATRKQQTARVSRFSRIWRAAVARLEGKKSPLLLRRLARIHAAFKTGAVCNVEQFRELLKCVDIDPDVADSLLQELEQALRDTLKEYARTDDEAFLPWVVQKLEELDSKLEGLPQRMTRSADEPSLDLQARDTQRDHLAAPERLVNTAWEELLTREEAETVNELLTLVAHPPPTQADAFLEYERTIVEKRVQLATKRLEGEKSLARMLLLSWIDTRIADCAYLKREYYRATETYELALKESNEAGDESNQNHIKLSLGLAYLRTGDPERANAAFSAIPNTFPEYGSVLTNMAVAVAETGQHDRSLQMLQRAQVLTKSPLLLSTIWHDMGVSNFHLQEYADAETNFRMSLELRIKLVADEPIVADDLAMTAQSLAHTLGNLGREGDALEPLQRAVDAVERLTPDWPELAVEIVHALLMSAVVQHHSGDDSSALVSCQRALAILADPALEKRSALQILRAGVCNEIGILYGELGQKELALAAYSQGEAALSTVPTGEDDRSLHLQQIIHHNREKTMRDAS